MIPYRVHAVPCVSFIVVKYEHRSAHTWMLKYETILYDYETCREVITNQVSGTVWLAAGLRTISCIPIAIRLYSIQITERT